MFERRSRPLGRLFYWLLPVAMMVAAARGQGPATTTVAETLFHGRTGSEKKDAAMSFVSAAISLSDAVANHKIADEAKFKNGLEQVINGVVDCLNASVWAPR